MWLCLWSFSPLVLQKGIWNSPCLLILLIHTKLNIIRWKFGLAPGTHFLLGELIHWVDKTKNVWLIIGQLPSCQYARPFDHNLGSTLIYFSYLHTTIRQKYTVLFHLFFLLCTTIRKKYMVFFHLFFLLCPTIRPKIKVHTDIFLYMYTTIRPKVRVFINLFI